MGRSAKADEAVADGATAAKDPGPEPGRGEVRGDDLEPIGVVQRELTRPDGTKVVVEVPVYPPFRLAEGTAARRPPVRGRAAPSLKRRRGGRSRKSGEGSS